MALVVELGQGGADSEAYVSAEDCTLYWDNHGFVWAAYDVPAIEAALRRATTVLDAAYRTRWPGRPANANGVRQALAWPRIGAYDIDGVAILPTEIPRELLAASCELAAREIATPGSLSPDMTTQRVLSESVAGAVAVTYSDIGDQRPIVSIVNDLLSGLVRQGSSGFYARG